MADNQVRTPATDAVKDLARFLHEPDQAPPPLAEMRVELKRAGFDTNRVEADFRKALEQAKGRARLGELRGRRTPLLVRFTELRERLGSVTDARAAARQIINEVFGGTSEAAVFSRKFEELTDADARTMIEDLTFLEEVERDARQKNP